MTEVMSALVIPSAANVTSLQPLQLIYLPDSSFLALSTKSVSSTGSAPEMLM